MPLKDLPTPDPKKVTRYHDNSFDALIDEALDQMDEEEKMLNNAIADLENRLRSGNFVPSPANKEGDSIGL